MGTTTARQRPTTVTAPPQQHARRDEVELLEHGDAERERRAQDQRRNLGASGSMDAPFPPKPKHMHWRKYLKLAGRDDLAQLYFGVIMEKFDERLSALSM